jgi:hypothetical protein
MVQLYNLLRILEPMPNLSPSLPRGNSFYNALFTTVLLCLDCVSLLVMWTPRNFKLSNLLHYSPVDEKGNVFGPLFPVVHNHLLREPCRLMLKSGRGLSPVLPLPAVGVAMRHETMFN